MGTAFSFCSCTLTRTLTGVFRIIKIFIESLHFRSAFPSHLIRYMTINIKGESNSCMT